MTSSKPLPHRPPDPPTAAQDAELDALVAQVRAGALSVDQALERLLARAVDGVGAALPPAARDELEGLLREALQSDPTLRALLQEAGR